MRRAAVLVNQNEFVTAAIEGAHAGVVLDPDADVLELGVNLPTSGQNFGHVAPVHADKMDRAIEAVTGKQEKDPGEEGRELGDAHLATRHREVVVVNRSQTTDIALDGDVVRRVDESHRGFFVLHEDRVGVFLERVPATDSILA